MIYIYIYIYIHTHTCVYIYIYIYTHIIHMYASVQVRPPPSRALRSSSGPASGPRCWSPAGAETLAEPL